MKKENRVVEMIFYLTLTCFKTWICFVTLASNFNFDTGSRSIFHQEKSKDSGNFFPKLVQYKLVCIGRCA